MAHVCPHTHVWTFDNFLRPLIHNPGKIFSPYVNPGMRVMDVGCGAGFASLGLARLVGDDGQVVAVDVQPQMLAKLSRRAARAGLQHRIKVHQSSERELGVEGPFHFINAFYMVHEVPEADAFLGQIYACLAPGGHFLVVEPKFHVSQEAFAQMMQLALNTGFKEHSRPSLLASRAVVLTKNEIHC